MKTTKKVLYGTLWMARGTATMVGFAVMLAVVLGVGTTALAAASGDPFKLGRTNTIDKITKLVGDTTTPMLRVENGGEGQALDLRVEAGQPPMTVDSTERVNDLNADEVDGQSASDFVLFDGTYTTSESGTGPGGGLDETVRVECDPGDKILGGGGSATFRPDVLRISEPSSDGWRVTAQDNGDGSTVVAYAICAETTRP